MTPKEELVKNIKDACMQAYDMGMKDGFNLAIKTIEESAYESADYEFAIWHAKKISKEKFNE